MYLMCCCETLVSSNKRRLDYTETGGAIDTGNFTRAHALAHLHTAAAGLVVIIVHILPIF